MKKEESNMKTTIKYLLSHPLLFLGILIAAVGLLGALVWESLQDVNCPGTEHNVVIGITIFIQAMIAFFGILDLEEPHRTKISLVTKGMMRSAIAAALVVTYLFLVIFHCMVEFTVGASTEGALSAGALSARESFVSHFTWIVGITISFYFASEAAIHAVNVIKGGEGTGGKKPSS